MTITDYLLVIIIGLLVMQNVNSFLDKPKKRVRKSRAKTEKTLSAVDPTKRYTARDYPPGPAQ